MPRQGLMLCARQRMPNLHCSRIRRKRGARRLNCDSKGRLRTSKAIARKRQDCELHWKSRCKLKSPNLSNNSAKRKSSKPRSASKRCLPSLTKALKRNCICALIHCATNLTLRYEPLMQAPQPKRKRQSNATWHCRPICTTAMNLLRTMTSNLLNAGRKRWQTISKSESTRLSAMNLKSCAFSMSRSNNCSTKHSNEKMKALRHSMQENSSLRATTSTQRNRLMTKSEKWSKPSMTLPAALPVVLPRYFKHWAKITRHSPS